MRNAAPSMLLHAHKKRSPRAERNGVVRRALRERSLEVVVVNIEDKKAVLLPTRNE
jgi:hypothetical protein